MMADYEVQMCDGDRVGEFYVKFHGPQGSTFDNYFVATVRVSVTLARSRTILFARLAEL